MSVQSLLLLSFFCASASGYGVTLNFDDPPVSFQDPYGNGDAYIEGRFSFSTSGSLGAIIRFNPFTNSFAPNNGSVHFGATGSANPSFELLGEGSFHLESIDFARYSDVFFRDAVILRGNYLNGGTIIETIPIGRDFATYELSSSWRDLSRVDFLSTGMSWDNVVVEVVPEPSAVLLSLCGLALFVGRHRRGV